LRDGKQAPLAAKTPFYEKKERIDCRRFAFIAQICKTVMGNVLPYFCVFEKKKNPGVINLCA